MESTVLKGLDIMGKGRLELIMQVMGLLKKNNILEVSPEAYLPISFECPLHSSGGASSVLSGSNLLTPYIEKAQSKTPALLKRNRDIGNKLAVAEGIARNTVVGREMFNRYKSRAGIKPCLPVQKASGPYGIA